MNDYYLIAKIISAGKDGYVKIHPNPGLDFSGFDRVEVFLDFWGKKKNFFVENSFRVKSSLFIKFLNFDSDREIQVLLGKEIYVLQENADKFLSSDYFAEGLIGFDVYREEQLMGVIRSVFRTPANYVLEIFNDREEEILIPCVQDFFQSIDAEQKKIMLKKDAAFFDDED